MVTRNYPEQAWGGVLMMQLLPQPLSEQLDASLWGVDSFSSWCPLKNTLRDPQKTPPLEYLSYSPNDH